MDSEDKAIITILLLSGLLCSMPILCTVDKHIKDTKQYNELPLTTGTVVDKVKIYDDIPQTMLLVDTNNDKDTVERVIFVKEDSVNNKLQKDTQIKFKDAKKQLTAEDIYQIDDLIIKQR